MPLKLSTAAVLALPVITGSSSVLWAWLTKSGPNGIWLAAGADFVSKAVLLTLVWSVLGIAPPTSLSMNVVAVFVLEVVMCVVISAAWFYPVTHDVPVAMAGLSEIGYPFFVVLFSILILKDAPPTPWQISGGALVILGSLLVGFGGRH